jgi:hypothetical protein
MANTNIGLGNVGPDFSSWAKLAQGARACDTDGEWDHTDPVKGEVGVVDHGSHNAAGGSPVANLPPSARYPLDISKEATAASRSIGKNETVKCALRHDALCPKRQTHGRCVDERDRAPQPARNRGGTAHERGKGAAVRDGVVFFFHPCRVTGGNRSSQFLPIFLTHCRMCVNLNPNWKSRFLAEFPTSEGQL